MFLSKEFDLDRKVYSQTIIVKVKLKLSLTLSQKMLCLNFVYSQSVATLDILLGDAENLQVLIKNLC